jgi:SAM-dependent methyltransferase
VIPYPILYRLGLTPWERRPVEEFWARILDRGDGLAPGRALDVGCGSGRDAVHLAKRGWRVTAVDFVDAALEQARRRAAEENVEVGWIKADVSELGSLGLEPGYNLITDFGCIHGLSDEDRLRALGAFAGLAAPTATVLVLAFKHARRIVLPRGMDEEELLILLGDAFELEGVVLVADVQPDLPALVRRARPALYRLTRRAEVAARSAA